MIIKRHFDQEMSDLRSYVESMSKSVLEMLVLCLEKITDLDKTAHDRITAIEVEVNRSQMRIDDLAWKIMALYQPTATDLRTLIGAIKIATDLERVGDEICALARRGSALTKSSWRQEPPLLIELQVMVRSLFKDGLTVLISLDEALAESIFTADNELDDTFQGLFDFILADIKKNPDRADSLLEYLAMGRSLERIGDHATNLAEIAVFMKKGQDVRHHGLAF